MTPPSSNPKRNAARRGLPILFGIGLLVLAGLSTSCATKALSPDTSQRVETKTTAGNNMSKSGNVTTNQGFTGRDMLWLFLGFMVYDLMKDLLIAKWTKNSERATNAG